MQAQRQDGRSSWEALKQNSTLRCFRIYGDNFSDETGVALAEALKHNFALRSLAIECDNYSDEAGVAFTAEPGMAAPFIQVSPTFNNTFLRCAAAARWNGSKKKLNSDRRHPLCNSDTTPVGNSFSVEATLEELAPAQRTEIAKRHWHESF